MRSGVPERRICDHKRNGTPSPLADPDVAAGFVIGKCLRRHRSKEFPDFPKGIDARAPRDMMGVSNDSAVDDACTTRTRMLSWTEMMSMVTFRIQTINRRTWPWESA